MTRPGAAPAAPACAYTWASNSRRTCDEPATTRLHLESGLLDLYSNFCDKHAAVVTKKYGGINPTQVIGSEPLSAAPITYEIQ